ncbi:MAG TPA: hypothetical protein VHO49_01760 [Anaerolineales bacterium]|nr:hypothetical protein [Anaerolineales bacterium]
MKRVLLSISILIMLLAACAPQAQPTDLPADIEEQATEIAENLTPAQLAAVDAVAQNLGLAAEQIRLVSAEAVEWPDSCLGITTEGIACAQVITSGYRIILDAAGRQVVYHTNEDGTVILPATEALTWSRSGGIAGFCDNLTIYLSGEVRGTNCKSSQPVVKRLSELLSADEIATLNEWISRYGLVEIDASDPEGVSDRMTINLRLTGTGTELLTDPATQQVLVQFVQSLNDRLMVP